MKIILFFTFLICSCSFCDVGHANYRNEIANSVDTVPYTHFWREPIDSIINVLHDVDLEYRTCILPKNAKLRFSGGVIKNGVLVGERSRIESTGPCFDRVRIQGTWDVPEISTIMFRDLSYDNSLKDVMALTNSKVKNKVVIEEGEYQMTAEKNGDVCLPIKSETNLILDGTIRLTPNGYKNYYILQAKGKNIKITGNGAIIGDKQYHMGNEGEWGMGICFRNAHNASVSGLTIKDCWGDCIYVGGKSTDVTIENCHLDHGRRQGISITSADGVTVRDCEITNVAGKAPEYAIDVEPNKKDLVDHVLIENVTVKDCKGGFMVYGLAKEARVGSMTIRNCKVEASRKCVISANKCDTFAVENCDIRQTTGCRLVTCKNVGHVTIKENTFSYNKVQSELRELARQAMGRVKAKPINISGCGKVLKTGNEGL